MDLSLERDGTPLGSLFQQIIADMKNTSPLWEDFVAKASKLHACLRAAIQAIAAYLDAFQKIADAATNSKGASKDIGTALTRVCLRHKAVETRMKTFTTAIMDCLVLPLQDKIEDWKRHVATLDKDHAKEYKRCRSELKKRSSDTLRLQKKARKGQSDTIQSLVDSHMQDVTLRRAELEDVERKSLRSAMVEERRRYCTFVNMLQPVVKEEIEVMSELGHLQDAMESIANVTKEPDALPQSSEELILESKSSFQFYPESPGGNSGSQGCSNSLGSRKSSVCSISSMNSSGSGSGSPGHHYQRSLSQLVPPTMRLKPGESSDSGFCSSPALTAQASAPNSQSHAVSTWPPHTQEGVPTADRPHTISSAYEKGHQRPALTVYTFQSPETIIESQKSPATIANRPPLPIRCSSLERPLSATGPRNSNPNLIARQCPSPLPPHITKELSQHQPTYVNMSELASMAALKQANQEQIIEQVEMRQKNVVNNVPGSDSTILRSKSSQPPPKPVRNINASNESNCSSKSSSKQSTTDSNSTTISSKHDNDLETQQQGSDNNTLRPSKTNNITSSDNTPNNSNTNTNSSPPILNQTNPFACNIDLTRQDSNSSSPPNLPTTPSSITSNNSNSSNNTNSTITTNTNTTTTSNINNHDEILKITENNDINGVGDGSNNSITTTATTTANNSPSSTCTNNTDIVINSNSNEITVEVRLDEKARGSVLEKMSMFEQASKAAAANATSIPSLSGSRSTHSTSSGDSIYSTTKDKESFKSSSGNLTINEKDPDQIYEDSIKELNNLIGELDSFQREHEMKEKAARKQNGFAQLNSCLDNSPFQFQITTVTNTLININGLTGTNNQQQQDSTASSTTSSTIGNSYNTINTLNNNRSGGINSGISGNGGIGNGSLETDNGSDKLSIGSLNYSSSMGNVSGSDVKFGYSDSEISRYISEDANSIGGFENPTFAHFNNNCSSNNPSISGSITGNDEYDTTHDSENHVIIYDQSYPIPPDIEFVSKNSEIVVLRCKETNSTSELIMNNTITDIETSLPPKQRLSSFKNENIIQNSIKTTAPITPNGSINSGFFSGLESPSLINSAGPLGGSFRKHPKPIISQLNSSNSSVGSSNSSVQLHNKQPQPPPHSPIIPNQSPQKSMQISRISSNNESSTATREQSSSCIVNSNIKITKEFKASLDERLANKANLINNNSSNLIHLSSTLSQSKPVISPRPASLSGCVTRIARRSSINSNKPPPPVRRSSSVTPSHNLSTPSSPCLNQQNLHNASSAESLPPPPAYLLDRQQQNPSPSSVNVAETVKALAAIRHTPASPNAVRRISSQVGTIQNNKSISNSASNNMYVASPTTMNEVPLGSNSIYNNSNNINQQQQVHNNQQQQQQPQQQNQYHNQQQQQHNQQQHHHSHHQSYQSSPKIPISSQNNSNTDSNYNNSTFRTNNSNSPSIYAQPNQLVKMSSFRSTPPSSTSHSASGSPLTSAKPNPSLIAQLNARLTSSSNSLTKQSPTHHQQHQQQSNDSTNYDQHYDGSSVNNSPRHQQYSTNNQYYSQQESLYSRGNERHSQQTQQQQGSINQQQQNYDDYSSSNESNLTKTGSIRGKSKAEFLENLNAKLAKQGLSGRALSVRNLINSKALPDPRICHESLMDQIKRGATLKRNQKINDRSAPKIH